MLDYLWRWTDPNALSQVVGALIGAGIAIGLWRAERHRIEAEKRVEERKRNERFKATLRSAVARLKRELDFFLLQCKATRSEIEAKAERLSASQDHSSSVSNLLERCPINIPNSFEFSEMHVLALNENSTELMSGLKDSLQELFVEIRSIKAQVGQSSDGVESLLEGLANAADQGAKSIALIEELDRSLQGGVTTRGI